MKQILGAAGALLADFKYAMMSAQSLAEVVASVIAAGELLQAGEGGSAALRSRRVLGRSPHGRPRGPLQADQDGHVARLDRCEAIIDLAD